MNSDSLNMVSRLGEGHMPCTFFLSEPQLKTTVRARLWYIFTHLGICFLRGKILTKTQDIQLLFKCSIAIT